MPTPRADNYSAASGAGIYAGTPAPAGLPAWLSGKPLNQWFQISGTTGPGAGLNTNAYCDLAINAADGSLYALASGGHTDGASNAAAVLKLADDAPAWSTLKTSSWNGVDITVPYYSDGTPCARHTYHHTFYIDDVGTGSPGVLLAGLRYGYGDNPSGQGMDLFSLGATKAYLPRFTWPDTPALGHLGVVQDGGKNIWTQTGYKFSMATKSWSKPGSGSLLRYPACYDSARDKIFALQFADGEGFGTAQVNAVELDPATGNSKNITFNASAALTQYIADAPQYAAMAYCQLDGKFYFLHAGRMGTFYVVTPNSSSVWDIATWTPSGSAPASSGVLCKRMLYVPTLKGIVVQSNQTANLSFVRMA